jgi:hypothetical protein
MVAELSKANFCSLIDDRIRSNSIFSSVFHLRSNRGALIDYYLSSSICFIDYDEV